MSEYSIKNLEALSGIKAQTIRVWERRYSIFIPSRTSTNIRKYSDSDLVKLLNLSVLIQHGHKISQLSQMTDQQLKESVFILKYKPFLHNTEIEKLLTATIEMDSNGFTSSLDKNIEILGFEESIINVVFPFLKHLGILWQTGNLIPSQEHFANNLIRNKVIEEIYKLEETDNTYAPLSLFFLPQGEEHELSLLFYQYIAKKEGHRVIYLGQNVPSEDLINISAYKTPQNVFTSFTSSISGIDLKAYIEKISETFQSSTIYITGGQLHKLNFKLPDNVVVVSSPEKFRKYYKN